MLPVGKLEPGFLHYLLHKYTRADERVLVGAAIGEDATVIDFGDTCLVAKTDPITFATDEIGWYAVNVNANDIAVTGGIPRWFLATILLPEGRADERLTEEILRQLASACAEIGVSLCGGHTEVTYGLDRPIVVGQMLGEVARDGIVTSRGGKPGDDLLLSKGIAIEATAIIAREKAVDLQRWHSADFLSACRGMLHSPGISVLKEARLAVETASVHAMHDPTEGGLATGVRELAIASGTGIVVQEEAIPVLPETRVLCGEYSLDPLGVIASGALLLTVAPADTPRILDRWRAAGISGAVIGRLVDASEGVSLATGEERRPLPEFRRDEITRIFEG